MPRPPTPGRFLARTLENSPAPMFALSGKREIVFANRALAQWLGIELEQLIGRRCDYASGANDPLTAACCALCPPPEAFAGQVSDGAVSRLASEHATFERRSASFLHVAGGDRDKGLLLVVL